jgi:c-di-GMP-binding flagellar brake protein YcgR
VDRRDHYRAEITRGSAIERCVLTHRGSSFSARLLDLSAGGASLRFLSRGLPVLPGFVPGLGQLVALRFPSLLLNQPLAATARVRHRAEKAGRYRYGLQFTDREQLESRLWSVFRRLFNRRRSVRVAPEYAPPVEVNGGGVRIAVALVDISRQGISVRIPAEKERALARSEHVELSVTLPGGLDSVHLDGIIRSRRLAGSQIDYGIEFDLERSPDAGRQQSLIGSYVTRCRRMVPAQAA